MVIGSIVAVICVYPIAPLRVFGNFYVQVFRNIPSTELLILIVCTLPYLDVVFSYEPCALMAMFLIPSAYCPEHLMSGMNTIRPGSVHGRRADH